VIRVTTDGSLNVINGIPAWVYEGEFLSNFFPPFCLTLRAPHVTKQRRCLGQTTRCGGHRMLPRWPSCDQTRPRWISSTLPPTGRHPIRPSFPSSIPSPASRTPRWNSRSLTLLRVSPAPSRLILGIRSSSSSSLPGLTPPASQRASQTECRTSPNCIR